MTFVQLIKPLIMTSAISLASAMFYLININTLNDYILELTHHSSLSLEKNHVSTNLFTLSKKILITDSANMITGITFILTPSQHDEITKIMTSTVSNVNMNNNFFEFISILSDKLQMVISRFKNSSIAKTKHEVTKTLIASLKFYQHD